MADAPSDYHRGEMDISEQSKTFHGFIAMTKWGSLAIAVAILFLALIFSAHANFFQAAGAAIVVLALGIWILREKKSAGGH